MNPLKSILHKLLAMKNKYENVVVPVEGIYETDKGDEIIDGKYEFYMDSDGTGELNYRYENTSMYIVFNWIKDDFDGLTFKNVSIGSFSMEV